MENIQVAVRVRPLNDKEMGAGETVPWKIRYNTIEMIKNEGESKDILKKPTKVSFAYDYCFGENHTNDQVYAQVARKVILSCLEGYNGTLFMYGQTGSGKTYTMLGYNQTGGLYNQNSPEKAKEKVPANEQSPQGLQDDSGSSVTDLGIEDLHEKYPNFVYDSHKTDFDNNTGILIQSLKDIFKSIEQDKERTFFLKCSYFEIYNDQIFDLLKPRGAMHEPLQLIEDVKQDTFVIKGITIETVASIKHIFEKLKKGEMNRHYAETFMNHSSSRSHCIFRISIKAVTNSYIKMYRQENLHCSNVNVLTNLDQTHEGTIVTESHLNFVDLAGSERMSAHIKPSGAVDDEYQEAPLVKDVVNNRINEGKHINKSLFFLTQVISLKAEGKPNQHIPYRNSPLTKILRSSLGGNFRTAVVLCINPSNVQLEHSLSTLRFGQNAKKIQNKIQANIITNNDDETIKILIENYEKRIRDLQQQQDEDLSKYDQYISVIDELKLQRTTLLERLEQLSKKLAIKMAEDIPEGDLRNFFKSVKSRCAFFPEVGFVFTSKDLESNYDRAKLDESTVVDANRPESLKNHFTKEMQSGPKEFLSKMSLRLYQKVKLQYEELKQGVHSQREYILNFCHSYKTLCEFMKTITGLGQTYLQKLKQIIEQYQDEYILSKERQIKLDLYESFKGMSLMSDKDLDTMTSYLQDFHEAIKSEKDRRELLKKTNEELPEDVFDGLMKLQVHEQEEQEEHMISRKTKIEDFVNFKNGCECEIEYYKSLYSDFNKQQQLEVKLKEIDKLINEDLVQLTGKLEAMASNFKSCDTTLEKDQKKELNLKLNEYKSKFEKLVDVVLAGRAKKSEKKEEPMGPVERASYTTNGGRVLKRSNSIAGAEDIFGLGSLSANRAAPLDKQQIGSKIKSWLNLKAIEDRPMNFESALKDETTSMSNFRSPIHDKGLGLNGSFCELKSQAMNNLTSSFAPADGHLKVPDSAGKQELLRAFRNTRVDPILTPRKEERSSFKLGEPMNKIAVRNYEIIDSPTGKNGSTRRREESKSYKASDYDSLNKLKRSFSNAVFPRAESPSPFGPSSLFGSATDFHFKPEEETGSIKVISEEKPLNSVFESKPAPEPRDVPGKTKDRQAAASNTLFGNSNHTQGLNKYTKNRPNSISLKKDFPAIDDSISKNNRRNGSTALPSKLTSSQKQITSPPVIEEEKPKPVLTILSEAAAPKRTLSKPSVQTNGSPMKEKPSSLFTKAFTQSTSSIKPAATSKPAPPQTKPLRARVENTRPDSKLFSLKKL